MMTAEVKMENNLDLSNLFEDQIETDSNGVSLEVEGQIPSYLDGSLYFTGQGKFKFGNFIVNHFIDGYSMISKYKISSETGITQYKKFLRSEALKKAQTAGKPVFAEFFTPSSTDVTKNLFGRWMTLLPENSDNGNHNMFYFNKKLFTSNGLQYFWQINPDDVTTMRKYDANKLFHLASVTPHPLVDYDGTMYNTGGQVSASGAKQVIFKIPSPNSKDDPDCFKSFKILTSFPMPRLMHCNIHHSCAMTENYLILIDMPYFLSIKKLFGSTLSGSFACMSDHIDWDPEAIGGVGNKFRLFNKKTGKMVKMNIVSSEPFFFLHYVNSFEYTEETGQGSVVHIVIDLLGFPSDQATSMMTLENIKIGKCCPINMAGNVQRFVIPLVSDDETVKTISKTRNLIDSDMHYGAKAELSDVGTMVLSPGTVSQKGIHCATINLESYRFRKYRYLYGTGAIYRSSSYDNCVVKFDLEGKEEIKWSDGVSYGIGEVSFVPRPGGSEEDDGVLICPVQELKGQKRGCIIILDGTSMTEIARAYLPTCNHTYNHLMFVPSHP